jgi:uncharacterized Tic20 family protein
MSEETPRRSPHEEKRRRRLALLCFFTALFGLLLGYIANNISGASQEPRDYLVVLYFGAAMLLTAVGMLIAGIVQGNLWIRLICALASYPIALQLIAAVTRINDIQSGP